MVEGLAAGPVRVPGVAALPRPARRSTVSIVTINPPAHDAERTGEQDVLFDDPAAAARDALGYRGPQACSAAGVTYRQLDYWARTGLVRPSVRGATGSGSQRLYSFRDIVVLKIIKRLLDTGVSLQQIRVAVEAVADRGADDLASLTLMSDGASVYECTSDDEVIDLVRGGQGVFGIAVSSVWREVEGSLEELPGVSWDETVVDELAARRARRGA